MSDIPKLLMEEEWLREPEQRDLARLDHMLADWQPSAPEGTGPCISAS